MGTLVIEPIPCLKDNYAYLIHDRGAARSLAGRSLGGRAAARRRWPRASWCCAGSWPPTTTPITWAASPSWSRAGAGAAVRGRARRRPRAHPRADSLRGRARPIASWSPSCRWPGGPLVARHIPGHTRGAMAWGCRRAAPSSRRPTCSPATPCSPPAAAACSRARPPRCSRSLSALTALARTDPALVRARIHRRQPPLRRARRARQPGGHATAAPALPAAHHPDHGGPRTRHQPLRARRLGRGAGRAPRGQGQLLNPGLNPSPSPPEPRSPQPPPTRRRRIRSATATSSASPTAAPPPDEDPPPPTVQAQPPVITSVVVPPGFGSGSSDPPGGAPTGGPPGPRPPPPPASAPPSPTPPSPGALFDRLAHVLAAVRPGRKERPVVAAHALPRASGRAAAGGELHLDHRPGLVGRDHRHLRTVGGRVGEGLAHRQRGVIHGGGLGRGVDQPVGVAAQAGVARDRPPPR